jgi:tetratricopeptide (TPR) repeat protein
VIFVSLLAAAVVGLLLKLGWHVARQLRIIKGQLAAYRKGDYRAQLQIVEGLRANGSEPANYLFFRGVACFELGRLDEAERALRLSLSKETRVEFKVLCRDQLGRVLMEQERWDEATACFRECIAESPKRGASYRSIAEALLRLGDQDASALEAARTAVAFDRAQPVARGEGGQEVHSTNLSESLAFLAWALAKNQCDPAEMESALSEAFALYKGLAKPILAELHFCAGHAYAARGNAVESLRQFQRATEIDPDGNYGRLSRSAARLHADCD